MGHVLRWAQHSTYLPISYKEKRGGATSLYADLHITDAVYVKVLPSDSVTAIFASLLHQQTGMMSQCLTPLVLIRSNYALYRMSVLFFSAGGRNPDALKTFDIVVKREPRQLMVLCATKQSPLGRVARKYRYVRLKRSYSRIKSVWVAGFIHPA